MTQKTLQDDGITKEEVFAMLTLGSPKLLQEAKKRLTLDKNISPKELKKIFKALGEAATEYKKVQRKGAEKLLAKQRELEERFLQEEIKKEEERTRHLATINRKLNVFLPKEL